ncbi:sigma-54 interaction domain-containing protein [Pelosinus propionicus]|uniref:Sigma-54 interaction domain-containing protein n=1 Tax=Pelosinus propionicus DSM 13327 TaxID=1123291 RepID=A0A1I4I404_9FIRM|nr:sigma 54-interacting transcriptional regulator [Pelosinus propionicus]SFL48910.1 Sigma-54 interaction domain-containing protein [Pelosinus propionicus DSM 13327]
MKTIGILTLSPSNLSEFIQNNLEKVFSDHITIHSYYLSDLKRHDIITDDVVVVTAQSHAIEAQHYISDNSRIILLRRTLPNREIYKITAIPKGTNVLVVNDLPETTTEAITFLYQLGITHLNLIAWDPKQEYYGINIAITLGEANAVPPYIKKIIDVGHRYIDISTFLSLLNFFNLDTPETSKHLIKYSDTIVTLDTGIKNRYKELFMKNMQLDKVVNLSHDAILLTDKDHIILLHNKKFSQLFDITENIIGKSIFDVIPNECLQRSDLGTMDELIQFKDRSLLASSSKIEYFGEPAGIYYNFQEVTYIRNLEKSLSKKLRESGLVTRYTFENIQTKSPKMKDCINFAKLLSPKNHTVLITGESGTGKELIAHSIHAASPRSMYPFIAINCASFPENLLESELFGYEAGSFTGAIKEGKPGLFEQANNGTIFLDEVGDMPLSVQVRLLRVLQERQIMRVGSPKVVDVDLRVIAATNKDLQTEIRKGLFRQDLFYRLNVLPIMIPPLRERPEDIIPLLHFFMSKHHNQKITLTQEAEWRLLKYNWFGNVRELINTAAYLSCMAVQTVDVNNLPVYILSSLTNFDSEFSYIFAHCDKEKAYLVLSVLENCPSGAGRKWIEAKCTECAMNITESEIRRFLSIFSEMDLVDSQVGRRGSCLTAKGQQFVTWLKGKSLLA